MNRKNWSLIALQLDWGKQIPCYNAPFMFKKTPFKQCTWSQVSSSGSTTNANTRNAVKVLLSVKQLNYKHECSGTLTIHLQTSVAYPHFCIVYIKLKSSTKCKIMKARSGARNKCYIYIHQRNWLAYQNVIQGRGNDSQVKNSTLQHRKYGL